MNNSPRKKYGKAEITMKTGGRTLSRIPPRRHAATAPSMVPIRNPRTVLTPTSPSDHGSASPMILLTDSGKFGPSEIPKFRWTQLLRYAKYDEIRLWWLLIPKATSRAFSDVGVM